MSNLPRALSNALRTMTRQPLSAFLVILTLAIGIGASTAILSVVNAILFRPLPYEDPDRLVFIWNRLTTSGVEKSPISGSAVVEYADQAELFEGFVAFFVGSTSLVEEGVRPTTVNVGWVQPNLFSLLGGEMTLGQMFGPEHEGVADPRLLQENPDFVLPAVPVILSYELWQRAFGGDPEVLGRAVEVNHQAMYIYGVAPKAFKLFLPVNSMITADVDAWAPIGGVLGGAMRRAQFLTVIGRMKPDVTLAEAQAEMDRIAAWQRENFEFERVSGMEIQVSPMHYDITAHIRRYLLMSLGVAGLVLLLMGFNVANLLLLRNAARSKEISIRAAMGGRPRRLVAERVVDSAGLVLLGCGLGLLLAHWGIRLLLTFQMTNLPRVDEAGLNGPIVAVSLGIALLVVVLSGVATAWQLRQTDLARVLTEWTSTGSRRSHRFRNLLVGGEIALSLVLLIGAGLMFRTAAELGRVDPGFRAENVLTAKVVLPWSTYRWDDRIRFFREVLRRAAEIPGVEASGGVQPLPFSLGRQGWFGPWSAEGMNPEDWDENKADYRQTMPGYFETMGIPLLQGRYFIDSDNEADARPVVIIDEVIANRAWPGEEAIGKQLLTLHFTEEVGFSQSWMDVVGVVKHVRDDDLTRDGSGIIYGLLRFYAFRELNLLLKGTTNEPLNLFEPLRDVVHDMDPALPLTAVRPMQRYLDEAMAPTRFSLALIGAFALIAAILAAVGLYGVISTAVQDRSQEIGIRMAMGAHPGTIMRLVLRQTMGLTLGGVVVGLIASFFLTRVITSLLYGVAPIDPLTFTAITVIQVVIALLAALVPAWRAVQVDPVQVLDTK